MWTGQSDGRSCLACGATARVEHPRCHDGCERGQTLGLRGICAEHFALKVGHEINRPTGSDEQRHAHRAIQERGWA